MPEPKRTWTKVEPGIYVSSLSPWDSVSDQELQEFKKEFYRLYRESVERGRE